MTSPPAGRPRLEQIDSALAAAAERLVQGGGVRAITVRALVEEAKTTRDAFYRRFSSLGAFLVSYALNRFSLNPTEDTGSLYGDLMVIQREQVQMYTARTTLDLLPLLMDALARDPQAATAFSVEFLQPRRQATVAVLERAVARGEIPPVDDVAYALDLLSGSIFLRAAMPGMAVIDDEFARKTVRTVMRELGASNAQLLL